ncbi:efflux RND transporter permease subunit [Thalassomonas actiniarum]|uniref:Efflux RND transporter permease subunit n=1 Tax=Thalassomonas actiniarum TaxID=485447 RepID=A0AAE9YS67_9GAMM|nr:efflux RND transporter permease subunit [Thalassomonas actiniarum]WDE00096.1 efflux RND transporter permease subunit [Thalassomonas actiniarum]
MKLTALSLKNPTAVVVGILLAALFGGISLFKLPVQLTPDISQPMITISTNWRSAAPEEMEAEIIERQEDVLKGLQSLASLESDSGQGRGSITLRYRTGVNLERALIDVMNALNQVPSYPPDADEPVIAVGGSSTFTAIAWFALKPLPGNNRDIAFYQDYVEEVIQTRLERVAGISQTNAFGGLSSELRISFNPYKTAALGLNIPELAQKLAGNTDSSGGFNDVGRRKYTLRFSGKYGIKQLEEMILEWRDGRPVLLRDVARVEMTFADRTGILTLNGEPAIAMNAQVEQGVNVIKVMHGLKAAKTELNRGPLKQAGLELIQMYDESIYIGRSMTLVQNNLLLGILLAISVLWWFLRKFRATLIVAVAIPISIIITVIVMYASGRSLNIISMAGLAFAVGMVLDAAIVVLENIVRLREQGLPPEKASLQGATQVWGALLASTATTIAIFLPIAFLEEVSGQLFADLAITIAVAISTSLIIAVTVLPSAARKLLTRVSTSDPHSHWWHHITQSIMLLTATPARRYGWILGLLLFSVAGSYLIFPKVDYLPKGNQNQFQAFIMPPPGLSYPAARIELSDKVNQRLMPYLKGEKQPKIAHTWMGFFGSFGFMGGRGENADDIQKIVQIVNSELLAGFPDTLAFATQAQLFRNLGGGRRIDIDIQGNQVDELLQAARIGYRVINETLPGAQIRPVPGLTLAEPELRLIPDERRVAEAGWTRQQVSAISRALGTGLYVGDFFNGQKRLNVFLRAEQWQTPEELAAIPLFTPEAGIQPVAELVELERTAGPSSIRRIDRKRTITLQVTPPADLSLEEAIAKLKSRAEPTILARLSDNGAIAFRGSAEALTEALANMSQSFLLALIILYLLMSALFKSFKDSLLVVLTIPLATVGGLGLLQLTNQVIFQPLDLLTMIGFVILLGLVVNNAILLVYQTRTGEEEGLSRRKAVEQAVRLRLRPILMSTLTSICGMLPLLLIPGAGAELYRGIAAVIVGGMSISTLFTLLFLPSLLQLGRHARPLEPVQPAPPPGKNPD